MAKTKKSQYYASMTNSTGTTNNYVTQLRKKKKIFKASSSNEISIKLSICVSFRNVLK